jgi:hypothetical protein
MYHSRLVFDLTPPSPCFGRICWRGNRKVVLNGLVVFFTSLLKELFNFQTPKSHRGILGPDLQMFIFLFFEKINDTILELSPEIV